MDFVERYLKAADRGDFKYEVLEISDTGGVLIEQGRYKDTSYVGTITNNCDEFEVEIDFLKNKPTYFFATRKSRKSARNLLERVIKNDEYNNSKNYKLINY